ncbi:MAG: hypothetical protein OHK0012_13100 [Synechococcales cyanobacterium]
MPDPQSAVFVVEDSRGTRTYVLSGDVCTIGRSRDNTIQITGEYVSRRHAYLRRIPQGDSETYEIVDGETGGNTPSTNGIYVNRQRVVSQVLRTGDLIHLGPVVHGTFLIPTPENEPVEEYLSQGRTTVFLDRPEDLISPDTGAETAHQMIPTVDWYLPDYYPEDLLELIGLGLFDNPQSAQNLKTAIYEQCQGERGIDPQWQVVLDRLETLKKTKTHV